MGNKLSFLTSEIAFLWKKSARYDKGKEFRSPYCILV